MAPEFPVDLTVLDMRFENGELVGSVHFVEGTTEEPLCNLECNFSTKRVFTGRRRCCLRKGHA